MADYFPVISRAVAGLNPNTGEARRAVYERARAAIVRQLKAIDPPLPEEDIARERMQLEEAIRRVEAGASGSSEPSAPRAAPAAPPSPPRAAAAQPAVSRSAEPVSAPQAPSKANDETAKPVAGAPRPGKNGKGAGPRPATRADGRPIVQSAGQGGKSEKKGRSGVLIAAGALVVIAVGAALFVARGQIASLFAGGAETQSASTDSKPADTPKTDEPASPPPGESKPDEAKSDDRLPQDQAGGETPAPSGQPNTPPADQGRPAAPPVDQQARAPDATAPAPQPEAPAQPPAADNSGGQPAGALVSQRAVLYEEGPNQQSGEALSGSIVWRTESVSAGQNRPLETALKGEIDIPARNLRAVLTVRRNLDATLPASHTIEIQFTLPPDFPNAGVTNVPGVLMKTDESARGAAVAGLSVKVTNGFFLIGLSNVDSEKSVNEQLLRDRGWIDIPILYENGRRAVLTLEKGTPGKQAFQEAFDAWKSASAGSQ